MLNQRCYSRALPATSPPAELELSRNHSDRTSQAARVAGSRSAGGIANGDSRRRVGTQTRSPTCSIPKAPATCPTGRCASSEAPSTLDNSVARVRRVPDRLGVDGHHLDLAVLDDCFGRQRCRIDSVDRSRCVADHQPPIVGKRISSGNSPTPTSSLTLAWAGSTRAKVGRLRGRLVAWRSHVFAVDVTHRAVPSPLVEVRVLGPVELFDGGTLCGCGRWNRRCLPRSRRASVSGCRWTLVEALWPEGAPPSARKTLQGHILRLRRAVGPAAIVEREAGIGSILSLSRSTRHG